MKSMILMLCVMVAACVDAPAESVTTRPVTMTELLDTTEDIWCFLEPEEDGGGFTCYWSGCHITCFGTGECIQVCSP